MALTKLNNQSLSAVTSAGLPIKAGSIIQVKHTSPTAQTNSFTASTWTDATGFSIDITPSSASSKFLILASAGTLHNNNQYIGYRIYRDDSAIVQLNWSYNNVNNAWSDSSQCALSAVDEPSTTSQVNYKVQVYALANSSQFYFNYGGNGSTAGGFTVMEIAG